MELSGSVLNVRHLIFSNIFEPGYDVMKGVEYLVSLETSVVLEV